MSRWLETTLGDACELYQPKTISSSELTDDGPYEVFGANGVIGRYHSYNHELPQLLITCRGATCGSVNVSSHKAWINGNAMVVRPRTEAIELKYLEHLFRGGIDLSVAITGAAQPQITRQSLAPLKFEYPDVAEQRRIAAILDQADALRTKRREALAQIDRLTQAIFVEMFGDPVKNPNGWPIRTLKELGKVSTGGTPPSGLEGMFGGSIPFVTPGDLESDEAVRRRVTEAGAREAGSVRAGATLVCCIGATIGKMGLAKERSSFNQQLNAVEWFASAVDDEYGLTTLGFFKPIIVAQGASTTLPILKKSSFEKISIPVAPLEFQRKFASRVAYIQEIRGRMQICASETSQLFTSLQHRAFRGEL